MANVLIIGGGVAGLSAGIHALQAGHKATICERHCIAGGNLTGWQRGEYHIDNCIHWLTGSNKSTPRYKLWENLGALGEGVKVHYGETLYTCELAGERLSLYKEVEKWRAEMLKISPRDKKEIDRLVDAVKIMQGVMGTGGDNCDEKSTIWQKMRDFPLLIRYFNLSTGDLSGRFSHPLLRQFIKSFIGDSFSSIALLITFATFCGADGGVPLGGSLKMAQRIVARFESLGGELIVNKRAVDIKIVDGRALSVCFSDGDEKTFDYLVLATDIKTAYHSLLKMDMPKRLQKQFEDERYIRFSSYHTAFACKTDKMPFEGDFIFALPREEQALLGAKYLALREFSHDKSFAPQGCTVLQTMAFCGEGRSREFIRLRKDKKVYESKKEELAERIEAIIVRQFPVLRNKLACLDVWTPATYERYYGEEAGAYMSFVFPKGVLPRRISGRVKGLNNVFLATQWQQAPGGLPTAASLGRAAALEIEKMESRRLYPWQLFFPSIKRTKKAKNSP